jgi:hypothetical protein
MISQKKYILPLNIYIGLDLSLFSASYPFRVWGAVSAVINNNPTVCGGYSPDLSGYYTDICHQVLKRNIYSKSSYIVHTFMKQRVYS